MIAKIKGYLELFILTIHIIYYVFIDCQFPDFIFLQFILFFVNFIKFLLLNCIIDLIEILLIFYGKIIPILRIAEIQTNDLELETDNHRVPLKAKGDIFYVKNKERFFFLGNENLFISSPAMQ